MSRPPRALQIAEPCGRVRQRQLARRPLLREQRLAVVEVPDLDAGVVVTDLRVDRGVILPDAPQAFGEVCAWPIRATDPPDHLTHETYLTHATHSTHY